MPGLHLLISMDNIRHDEKREFMNTLGKMKHFQWYLTDVLCNDASMIIGRSYYDGYPFAAFQSKKGVTLIEGAIYNKSDRKVKSELDKISLAESSQTQLSNKVKKFVLTTHGEFIVVKYNRDMQKCLIFNDALGRLPFYYCSSDNQLSDTIVFSREMKFIVPFLLNTDFDIFALAEYLLFGYPLGDRTLLKFIKRLPPATVLMIDTMDNEFRLKKVLSWNLEPESQNANQLKEQARKLVKLFLTSSMNIAQTFSKDCANIVGLSGGLDSRATLAGLVRIGANPVAYSYLSGENRIAKKIAQKLKVRHQVISSSFKMTNEDFVNLTDGLIGIRMLHLMSYLYGVREKVKKKGILYTGDGGWQLKCHWSSRLNISNMEGLVRHILETENIFEIDEVSSMLNLRKSALKEHLKKHIVAYPEKTMEGKLAHFLMFERSFKWYFPGEDKNRFFLWSTTPFYSIDLFRASMNIPQRSKEHFILYKNFFDSLNPSLARIQYYDKLVPLSLPSWLLKPYLSVFERLQRLLHEPGTISPIDLLFGKRAQERTDETRKLILQFSGQESGLDFLELSQVSEIIKKTANPAKLGLLATLAVYAGLAKSSRDATH